jgi:hypothetical protein
MGNFSPFGHKKTADKDATWQLRQPGAGKQINLL